MAPQEQQSVGFSLPLAYRVFFLVLEPLSATAGAYYAQFRQRDYLVLTHAASAPASTADVPTATSIMLSQLANMYLYFALIEALVLRSTADLRVWKTVLFVLLFADVGHLYSVKALGLPHYWNVAQWNLIDWGNIAFVYLGAAMRLAFLADVGLGRAGRSVGKAKKG